MTTFYAVPNSGAFWHWTTLLHFLFVAVAGGVALLTAYRALTAERPPRRLAWISLALIVLDLIVLWGESPARFRLTHVYLFLTIHPTSAIWWGGWALGASALLTFLLALGVGPRRVWGALLALSATVALLYPGLALAANTARPLWTPLLLAFIPLSSLLLALGLALLFRQRDLRPAVGALALVSGVLALLYLVGLAVGDLEAREGLRHFWQEGGPWYLVAVAAMLASPALLRRAPALAGLVAVAGAFVARSLIIEIGQHMGFGL